jgi:hypothetical protein
MDGRKKSVKTVALGAARDDSSAFRFGLELVVARAFGAFGARNDTLHNVTYLDPGEIAKAGNRIRTFRLS